jgi:alkylhydroperoxidase/carboxymuconolactone decarboxylase family protein YurZ
VSSFSPPMFLAHLVACHAPGQQVDALDDLIAGRPAPVEALQNGHRQLVAFGELVHQRQHGEAVLGHVVVAVAQQGVAVP